MNLQEKFNILLTKFNLGKFDEVIFEATLMSKKYPAQEVFINLLSLSYQAKGEFNKSILILEEALRKGKKNFNFWNNLGLGYLKIKNFTTYFDDKFEVAKLLKLRGIPITIILNSEGKEIARVVGSLEFDSKSFINKLDNL